MKYLVLGAGQMGYAVVFDLVRSPSVDKIFLADIDESRIAVVMERFADERIVPCKLDVTNLDEVVSLMSGCDVAISCVTYRYNFELTKAALEAGINFIDLGGNHEIAKKQMLFDDLAKERKITFVPDCGLAPGLVSILAAASVEGMDEIYEMRIRVGGLPVDPQPPLNYSLSFSVEGLINEYIEDANIILEGRSITIPSLTNIEEIEFPKPFGTLQAFTTSGGISTLPQTFAGRIQHLDYKTIRYPGHCEAIRAMALLGLMDCNPINVNSDKVIPRKLLERLLEEKLPHNEPDVVLLRLTTTGIKDRRPTQVIWEAVDYMDQAAGLTSMMRMTAFPASIIAQMIARDDISETGTLCLEKSVPTGLFLAEIASRGIRLSMLEREPVA